MSLDSINGKKLIKGYRYSFEIKKPKPHTIHKPKKYDISFIRADFYKIHISDTRGGEDSLLLKNHEADSKFCINVYPLHWIASAFALEDIIPTFTKLPVDVLRVIDWFL
jgi:hypothetical protein